MGSRRVVGTYIQCRRSSSSTLHHLYPPPYSPLPHPTPPPVGPLLSRCSTFPRQLVRASLSSSSFRAPCMYFSSFLSFFFILKAGYTWSEQETPWESEQSVFRGYVTHSGPRYHRRNARSVTRRTVAAELQHRGMQREHVQSRGMRFEFALASLFHRPYVRVAVQIGRASRTYARKLSSVFLATWKNIRAVRGDFRARILDRIARLICVQLNIFFFL